MPQENEQFGSITPLIEGKRLPAPLLAKMAAAYAAGVRDAEARQKPKQADQEPLDTGPVEDGDYFARMPEPLRTLCRQAYQFGEAEAFTEDAAEAPVIGAKPLLPTTRKKGDRPADGKYGSRESAQTPQKPTDPVDAFLDEPKTTTDHA